MDNQKFMIKTIIVRGILFLLFIILISFFIINNSDNSQNKDLDLSCNILETPIKLHRFKENNNINLLNSKESQTERDKHETNKQKELKSKYNYFEIHLDKKEIYDKIKEITGWQDKDLIELFVEEAKDRDVSIFEEALPIADIETGGTYKFDVINHNNNGTVDKGLFQINDVTKPYIIDILNSEGIHFDNYSRLNPEFNIVAGLTWIEHLKEEYDLEGHALFSSYNRGVGGANQYFNTNNTYRTSYSKSVKEISRDLLLN